MSNTIIKPEDFRGLEIKIGETVAYVYDDRSGWLKEGVVKAFSETQVVFENGDRRLFRKVIKMYKE